jgi:hypothetical protein
MLVPTALELKPLSNVAWGLVTVASKPGPDGVIERQFVISGAEADLIRAGVVLPRGVTQAVWDSGCVSVKTRPLNPGQALVSPDGGLIVNCGVRTVNKRVKANVLNVPRNQWGMDSFTVLLDASLIKLLPVAARVP